MIYEKINLIAEMLDATLNLKCIHIKYLESNLEELKRIIPLNFMINKIDSTIFFNSLLETKENHVYVIEDYILGNYIIICLDENKKQYLFVGPYLLTNNHEHLLKNWGKDNISNGDLNLIKKYYASIPFIDMPKITAIISVIKKSLYKDDINLTYIFKRGRHECSFNENMSENLALESINYKFVEERAVLEYKLLSFVKSGNKVNSIKTLDKILDLDFIDDNSYNLRNCKNKLIYYNTLLSKNVQSGCISSIHIENLFKVYLDKIELANSIDNIKKIFYDMVINYCFAITEFNVRHFSVLVGRVINYINSNLQNDLSVNNIANLFFVSPTYLSRVFKKETGFSIIEYINRLKIKHATFLLRDTYLPIQDISRIIGINDINYFSRVFKKYMNETPTQYRKTFK